MINYHEIFNNYSINGVTFSMMNKDIVYPDDKTLEIYDKVLIAEDIAWTILSYKIYGTIKYWWVLAGINRHQFKDKESSVFYAPAGSTCYFIKKKEIDNLFSTM